MEALSLTSDILSENSWSLALTDDSFPDDNNTFLLNAPESNVHTLVTVYSDVYRVLNTVIKWEIAMAFSDEQSFYLAHKLSLVSYHSIWG